MKKLSYKGLVWGLFALLFLLIGAFILTLNMANQEADAIVEEEVKQETPYIVHQYKLGSAARPTVHRIWYYPAEDIYSVEFIQGGSQ